MAADSWFNDACILDMDYFVKTVAAIKAKGVRPDLVGSIISHYASKWLPELAEDFLEKGGGDLSEFEGGPPESAMASWMKKRFFAETLVGILPTEQDSVACDFLLRLLRAANMVGVEPSYRLELEKRVSWQLERASLKELMIPSFSHACGTLLDIELVLRLVKSFVSLEVEGGGSKSGAALVKVAKLVDCYLAEAAVDSNLSIGKFVALASVLPGHARSSDDGLYRAIDTYLKAHPNVSKQGRKTLCELMDSRKLSPEASLHVAQNERLPVRVVIQVLFSEQAKLNRHLDWSGSFSGARSPKLAGLETPARCLSKREESVQQAEIWKLREEVARLQSQCGGMQAQIERMLEKKSKGFFRWKKIGLVPSSVKNTVGVVERVDEAERVEAGFGTFTPVNMKTRLVRGRTPPKKWRKSTS
ncbi:root phototropism protein 3-like isoform X2 [Rhodamnia argentea]|nr:root phototropism protein 3-like isoform X2 [Rhodamnia argentea]